MKKLSVTFKEFLNENNNESLVGKFISVDPDAILSNDYIIKMDKLSSDDAEIKRLSLPLLKQLLTDVMVIYDKGDKVSVILDHIKITGFHGGALLTVDKKYVIIDEYKLTKGKLERIKDIPEDITINDYIKSDLIYRKGQYFWEDDDSTLIPLDIEFVGNDVIILKSKKYKLSKDAYVPGDLYFDLRYPNEINQLSEHSKDNNPPFGYKQQISNNRGNSWVEGNDCFFKAIEIN